MSAADIPFEIQEEIIRRVLPVKSLIRFRSVSKEWKSLIDSPEFITTHHHNSSLNNQAHHLLIACKDNVDSKVRYVSVVDDDISFPNHTFAPSVSPTVSMVIMLGCSHGLVCLVGLSRDRVNIVIVVWNPSIRKSFVIVLPFGTDEFGFGVCPRTSDPKIVMIPRNPIGYKATAEVFTLSSGAWRSISMNLPQELVIYTQTPVVIDGVIHWVAHDVFDTADDAYSRIISFDLTSEEFGQLDLPDCLIGRRNLGMSKLKQSLVVLDYNSSGDDDAVCDVWMMLKDA
ncbi:putative F-box domain-containing protein [Helianthus annuus]|nr:putative F-box domain-containing protein [Helianthus annuus]